MKKAIVNLFAYSLSVALLLSLILTAIKFYPMLQIGNESVKKLVTVFLVLFIIAAFMISVIYLPVLLKCLFLKEYKLYQKIRRRFPKWHEVNFSSNYLSISWFEGYRNNPEAVHNYYFYFDEKKAKFDVSTDKTRVWFEGTIEEALVKL